MKRSMKLLAALLVVCLLLPAAANAASRDYGEAEEAAQYLASLGVFKGSDDGFELDRAPTRIEALIMLLRLLGQEDQALACKSPCIFTDVKDWAMPYVAYAYEMGYASGSEVDPAKGVYLFGVGNAGVNTYLTFVLRALGYGDDDFSWEKPQSLAKSLGLLPDGVDTKNFLRADLALISQAALKAHMKGSADTLGDRLGIAPRAISVPAAVVSVSAASASELYLRLNTALAEMPMRVELHVSGALAVMDAQALLELALGCGSTWFQSAAAYTVGAAKGMTLEPLYTDAALAWAYWSGLRTDTESDQYRKVEPLIKRANQALADIGATFENEKEQVLAIHDWLAANAAYDEQYTNTRRNEAAGVLLDGSGVCDSYSLAFWLLCRMRGIDCFRVCGSAGGNHSWNKVKVDGSWYNVDLTWDDAVYYLGGVRADRIFYDYFLVSDAVMALDHVWVQYSDMPSADASYGD